MPRTKLSNWHNPERARSCLWDILPPDLASASTPIVFQQRLKTYLVSRSFPFLFSVSNSVHHVW